MDLLKEFFIEDKCSYLDGREQKTHYKMIDECDMETCEALIERGFRRFGKMYFRPVCSDCNECKSIKIDVQNYEFSKSARRILKKTSHLISYIQKPTLTREHMKIFKKYHLHMQGKKNWDYTETSPENYHSSFVSGHKDFGYEVLYYNENELIAVDLIDVLENGISSIYFFYDPDYSHLSLGKFSLYNQIKLAKNMNKSWIYLGYYVKDCPSLSYKSQYKPYVTLKNRPGEFEQYEWL